MTTQSSNNAQSMRSAWRLVTTSYLCMLGILFYWHLRVLPVALPTALTMLAPLVIPLLIAGPGLFRGKPYTYQWMSLVIWIWFAHGTMEAWTHRETPVLAAIASLESILAVIQFIGMVKFLRLLKPAAK